MKRLCAALASVSLFAISSPFLPVVAADVPDSAVAFESLMTNYGLSGLDISGKTVTYCYGVNPSNGSSQAALWVDGQGWKRVVNSDGTVRFDGPFSYWFQMADAWCGHLYMAVFYYSTTDDFQLTSFSSSDGGRVTDVFNYVSSVNTDYNNYTFVTGSGASLSSYYDDYVVQVSPVETTTDTTSGGGFQLPEDWISGGQTLPVETEVTYPEGFDPESAFADFESMTVEIDESVGSGIGFFWELLIRSINALSLMPYVFFALLLSLVVWFLKGM